MPLQAGERMAHDKSAVRKILDQAKAAGRSALTAPEAKGIAEAYGIAVPKEGVASTAAEAAKLAARIGYPVVMKIVSPQILHKTEAGGVVVGVKNAEAAQQAFATIVDNARRYNARATIDGVQIQQMLSGGQEVIIGAVAVIGASAENGKIGNSIMKNLINGGYQGAIYPIHPSADSIMGKKVYKSVKDVPGGIDVAVFAIPAKFVAQALIEVGEKKIPGAVLIPSGFAETGNVAGQEEVVSVARKYDIRRMGPNIYVFYYTPKNLCATFCTAYDFKGVTAFSSQSGGIGMAIIGFSRSAKMGVSAIVGLGNKSDIDEDELLTFFEQDD